MTRCYCRQRGWMTCACDYLHWLEHDPGMAGLRDVALAQVRKPDPHRPACPCPRCYAARLASWQMGATDTGPLARDTWDETTVDGAA